MSAAHLDGTTYKSTSVSGHDLVDGTEVTLSFEDGVMTASAGCNTLFGAYEFDQDTLRWSGPPASSLLACSEDQENQDQWLTTLLSDGVTAAHQGSVLTLISGEVTLELSASPTPPPATS